MLWESCWKLIFKQLSNSISCKNIDSLAVTKENLFFGNRGHFPHFGHTVVPRKQAKWFSDAWPKNRVSDATLAKRTYITLKLLQKSVLYFFSYKRVTLSFHIFENFAYNMHRILICPLLKIQRFLEKNAFFCQKIWFYSILFHFFPFFNLTTQKTHELEIGYEK